MRRFLTIVLVALLVGVGVAQEVPPPDGFVTDRANVIDPATKAKLTALIEDLRRQTGVEIAVLTVDSTQPLDDFTYAMNVADAWKVGRRGEDSGLLVLVAVRDRKIRVLTGYGLEGVLPDGLVGAIQDREMVPEFRAGRVGEGIWRGVAAFAERIAAARGVVLTGVPPARQAPTARQPEVPLWVLVLVVVLILVMSRWFSPRHGLRYGRRGGPIVLPGGVGRGFPGGFGGGGGGFGGFGGGGFGGGGAGRSW